MQKSPGSPERRSPGRRAYLPLTNEILRLPAFAVIETIEIALAPPRPLWAEPAPPEPAHESVSITVTPRMTLIAPDHFTIPRGDALVELRQRRSEYLTKISVRLLTEADFADQTERKL